MHRTALLAFATVAIAALATLPAATARAAQGDVYRRPPAHVPATGPSVVKATSAELARVAAQGAPKKRQGAALPDIDVRVTGPGGGAGVAVLVDVRGRKSESAGARFEGATDADGRFTFSPAGALPAVTKVHVFLQWDEGEKTVGASLEAKSGKWRLAAAPYRNAATNEPEGSCANLFTFSAPGTAASGAPRVVLDFRKPETLFGCKEIVYGGERKTSELARVESIGARDVNRGDKNMFSRDDETKMGLEASTEFDKQFEAIQDPVIVGYVENVMKKIVAASDEPTMPIHLRIVHTDDVNAFVTAGGHVYVFTGLLAAVHDESQLAGVLAHEASHAIARHVTEGATRQLKTQIPVLAASLLLGKAADLDKKKQEAFVQGSLAAAGLVGMRFDRKAESEADLLGSQYLWRAGWDPEAIARFFEVLEATSSGQAPPAWMSTHPSHETRVANGVHWARAFLPDKDAYLMDTAALAEVKRRIAALPPPKKKPTAVEGKAFAPSFGTTPTYDRLVGRELQRFLGEASGTPAQDGAAPTQERGQSPGR